MKKFFVFLSLLTLAFAAQAQTGKSRLDGRWYLTFDLPDSVYRTTAAFKVSEDNTIKAAILGEPVLSLSDGTFVDNQIKLNGKSAYGDVVVTASLADEKIIGKWSLGFIGGDVTGVREPADKPKTDYSRVFEQTWKTINEKFYDPNFNGVDWKIIGDKYRPSVQKMTNYTEFIGAVRAMLKELKVSHVGFYYSPFESEITAKNTTGESSLKPISWKKIAPTIGYLQIKEFTESPTAVADVDKAFAEIGDAPNLIVDLRGNTGGTLSVAMRLGDYLFDKTTPVGFFSTREGLKRYQVNSMDALKVAALSTYTGYKLTDFWTAVDKNGAVAIVTGGRSPKTYRGKIIILVDERCASTTEAFIAVVKEQKLATIIGRRTRGAVLSAVSEKTAGDWLVKYPKADYRTPQNFRIEGVGIEPDVLAEKSKELEQALKLLEKQK